MIRNFCLLLFGMILFIMILHFILNSKPSSPEWNITEINGSCNNRIICNNILMPISNDSFYCDGYWYPENPKYDCNGDVCFVSAQTCIGLLTTTDYQKCEIKEVCKDKPVDEIIINHLNKKYICLNANDNLYYELELEPMTDIQQVLNCKVLQEEGDKTISSKEITPEWLESQVKEGNCECKAYSCLKGYIKYADTNNFCSKRLLFKDDIKEKICEKYSCTFGDKTYEVKRE